MRRPGAASAAPSPQPALTRRSSIRSSGRVSVAGLGGRPGRSRCRTGTGRRWRSLPAGGRAGRCGGTRPGAGRRRSRGGGGRTRRWSGVGAGAGDLQGDEPQDVGQQGIDDADGGLVGESGRPQHPVDGLAQPQAVGAEAGLLEGVGDDGGVGEELGADPVADGGQLFGPILGGVGVEVDEPVDQVGLAPNMGVGQAGASICDQRRKDEHERYQDR
jgi:hypothetical protein